MHTHTHHEHTPGAVGSHFYVVMPRDPAVGDSVPCSRAPQSWYWDNPCWSWDSNLRPLGYEPVSLTIRPWLHHKNENNIMERMLKEWRIYILLPGKYVFSWPESIKTFLSVTLSNITHFHFHSCELCLCFKEEKKSSLFRLHIIKCEYLKSKTSDGEQTLKSSDLWIHWACIFIKLQKQMFSENFRLFIDFHLWSLSKSVWGAPTGLQGFDEGVMFQTWLHTVPCQLLGYDNR